MTSFEFAPKRLASACGGGREWLQRGLHGARLRAHGPRGRARLLITGALLCIFACKIWLDAPTQSASRIVISGSGMGYKFNVPISGRHGASGNAEDALKHTSFALGQAALLCERGYSERALCVLYTSCMHGNLTKKQRERVWNGVITCAGRWIYERVAQCLLTPLGLSH
ncbi:MAG: hypothetical protein JKY61_11100 [Planctomycetes bacterium]|nr:hypothetical protein [Planctomycetota bacterium]